MDIRLKCCLHLHENFLSFRVNSEILENIFLSAFQNIFISTIKIQQISEMQKLRRNREIEDPLIVNTINGSVRNHEVFKETVHVGNGYDTISHFRNIAEYLFKFLAWRETPTRLNLILFNLSFILCGTHSWLLFCTVCGNTIYSIRCLKIASHCRTVLSDFPVLSARG